eukprot:g18775.t1
MTPGSPSYDMIVVKKGNILAFGFFCTENSDRLLTCSHIRYREINVLSLMLGLLLLLICTCGKWKPVDKLDRVGFNEWFLSSSKRIIKRECGRCLPSHREIYYRRKRQDQWQPYQYMWVTWSTTAAYSTLAHALAGTNSWQYFNGDDPGIGFPRDSGPTGKVDFQWNSLTDSTGQQEVFFYILLEPCDSSPCQHGTCSNEADDSYSCRCDSGYTGSECQQTMNECQSNPCQNGGICVDGVNSYSCTCMAGYTGTDCQQVVSDCEPNPCRNGGVCVDHGRNSYTCDCASGFTGVNCQQDVDDCEPNPCQNGGICVDGPGSYSCDCPSGYSGTHCHQNIDECDPNPCQHGGICEDGVNSYSCTCMTGYTGTYCQKDVNDCESNPCQNGSEGSPDRSVGTKISNGTAMFVVLLVILIILVGQRARPRLKLKYKIFAAEASVSEV